MLRLYNTLSEKKEEFKPLKEGTATVYACGMTVYDKPHIGHARKEVAFDVIIRYMRYIGLDVKYVRNITDIDDKIIARANERNIDFKALTEENIDAFNSAMDALGVSIPNVEPKATEHIDDIIAMVQTLIDKNHAYEADGSVYFSVRSFNDYGKLSKRNVDDMLSGTRFDVEDAKKDPADFALWKKVKDGEPYWDSPWGKGRPGWHIECSVMSTKYLGDSFDIHGGGRDLIFPHHENEIAQAEAATGQKFVNYWVHNGFLNVEGEKMSKSLGNFITVDDALEKYHPEVLRYFMISTHYRTPINFSLQNLQESEKQLSYFYSTIAMLKDFATATEPVVPEKGEEFINLFREAMDDDFNTPKVLAAVFNLFKYLNDVYAKKKTRPDASASAGYLKVISEMASVLGILNSEPLEIMESIKDFYLKRLNVSKTDIDEILEERAKWRSEKNFAKSDECRDRLINMGIAIKDTPTGTEWGIL